MIHRLFKMLPTELSKLSQNLRLKGSKGYFPHFFFTVENQSYIGPLPPMEYYGVDNMMFEEKKHFLHGAQQLFGKRYLTY